MTDISPDEFEARLAAVASGIEKALAPYLGRALVTEETLACICETVRTSSGMGEPRFDDDRLQFMVGERVDEIVPANLYTTLRMAYGLYAPSWEDCEGGEWTAPDGTVYTWQGGTTYMRTPQPMLQIIVEVAVDECDEFLEDARP